MTPRRERLLYFLQRLSALILVPLVILHLGVMILSVQGGLSTAEILSRTQSSNLWPMAYGLFFAVAGVHGCIGLRNILKETTELPDRSVNRISGGLLIVILVFGFETVRAIA